jgi:hypothetical protein
LEGGAIIIDGYDRFLLHDDDLDGEGVFMADVRRLVVVIMFSRNPLHLTGWKLE